MSDNDKVSQMPPKMQAPPQTFKAAVVPLEFWNEIGDKMRNLPHREVDGILRQMQRCGVADVPIEQPPAA